MLSAIAGCRIEAYGVDTLTYRALLDNAATRSSVGTVSSESFSGG